MRRHRHDQPTSRSRAAAGLALVVALLTLALPSGTAQAAIHWSYDLEYATISGNVLTDNGRDYTMQRLNAGGYPTISTDQARNGSHSLKAAIPPSGYARSEIANALDVSMRSRHAVGFSVYVPSGHQPPRGAQWEMFAQFWQTGCGSPPISIDLQPNTDPLVYRVLLRNDATGYRPTDTAKTLAKGSLPRNQWVQFSIEFNAHPTDPGQADFILYVNQQVVSTSLNHTDTIGYSRVDADCDYPVNNDLHLKNGIYRGGAQWDSTQVLYFDDMRFGDQIEDVWI